MDYFEEFSPLYLLAKKYALMDHLSDIQANALVNAKKGDFKRYVDRIQNQILNLERDPESRSKTYQENWKRLFNMSGKNG